MDTPTMDTMKRVGEYVAEDYRSARVFERYGIDFCCGGEIGLEDACRERGVDPARLLEEIAAARSEPQERGHNYAAWGLSLLSDYIVETHHGYLRENTGQILVYARKIAEVHGDRHPEVKEIAGIFQRIATDMAAHLREEEEVLFPAVKRIDAARKAGQEPGAQDAALLAATLATLHEEHEAIGTAVHDIRDLSRGYTVPPDVCTTFALTYRMLREFEDDLHKHVHLENNILFPKAAGLV